MEYFALMVLSFSMSILMSSPLFISMFALLRSPVAVMLNLFGSAMKLTLSATMSTSSMALLSVVLGRVMLTGKVSVGTFCSRSSNSRRGMLNVLIVFDLSCTSSLLSFVTLRLTMSFALARLRTCLRFVRLRLISFSSGTSYVAKQLLRSLKMIMATFAGSIAISSISFFFILNLPSVTSSEMMVMLSLR